MKAPTARAVLIVEDSPVQASFLRQFIELEGFVAAVVGNGRDALAAMHQWLPDLVLADVNMPIMGGFELCRAVREDPVLRRVPLILLTTLNDPRDLLEGLAAGADAYLFKPFVEADLRARIQGLLGRAAQPLPASEPAIDYAYGGGTFRLAASRERMLDFLIMVYENARHQNEELREVHYKLQQAHRTVEQRGRELEEAKAAAEQHLDEVTRMNAYLTEMNAKLEQARTKLWQAEKLAAVGQLAAGVAHEINNPVGFIKSNLVSLGTYVGDFLALIDAYERLRPGLEPAVLAEVDRVRERIGLDYLREDVRELIRESAAGAVRVAKIVQDLRNLSRIDSSAEWSREDLHVGLDRMVDMACVDGATGCVIRKDYGELPLVECAFHELNQVFLTLLVNAVEAISGSGVVSIATRRVGDEVHVEIGDTGSGIAPENLDRIFDPFFTTKPVGKGTGLGLPVARSIVAKHHGRLEVSSTVGAGTTFRICLPVEQPPER